MTKFCIETYINGLPEDTEFIDVNSRQLNYLPDLNRFKNLKILYCNNNRLVNLPPLNSNLKTLYCDNNLLTFLPPLNANLQKLYCYNNQLTCLPSLNENLLQLYCYNNRFTFLPSLNAHLEQLHYNNNPIYEIIDSNDLFIINTKLQILHKFCYLYYCLKFKTQFRDLLWQKIREPKIMKNYHPSYLNKLLIDGTEDLDIDLVINSWI
jgi:hypothetical protein